MQIEQAKERKSPPTGSRASTAAEWRNSGTQTCRLNALYWRKWAYSIPLALRWPGAGTLCHLLAQ